MICVGITGSYASGKTFVLNYLADLGFMTFSADEYIKELYKELSIQNIILNLLPDLKIFDKRKIAELISVNDLSRSK
ncbi:MAG: dephospho-CoA kinase [Rickettsia endosymbiont of Labidopullus appendiculatus]|nr:dephospho-CoA kinase [Rickettsia endosymbiont of Labidopullus appendiculatus]